MQTASRAMFPSILVAAATVAAALAGCGEPAPMQVYSEWGPGLRFSEATRTFDWVPGSEYVTGEGRPVNPNVDPLLRKAIVKHFARRGYEKVTGAAADFWIDYRVGKVQRGDPYGGANFTYFTEGTLAVYAISPATRKLIWRGVAQVRIVDEDTPEMRDKKIEGAVRALLDEVPARKKAT